MGGLASGVMAPARQPGREGCVWGPRPQVWRPPSGAGALPPLRQPAISGGILRRPLPLRAQRGPRACGSASLPRRDAAPVAAPPLCDAPPRRSESAPPSSSKVAGIREGGNGRGGREGCSGRGRTWADLPRGCAALPPRARPPPRSPLPRRRPPPPQTRRGSTPQPRPWVSAEAPPPKRLPSPPSKTALSVRGSSPGTSNSI